MSNTLEQVQRSLNLEFKHFTGTVRYYKYSFLFQQLLTDGTYFIGNHYDLFWFYDIILSYQNLSVVKEKFVQRWVLRRLKSDSNGFQWEVVLLDDSNNPLIRQGLYFISLNGLEDSFDIYTVFVSNNVILLPSEN